ncbi:uncharacterized protein LOC110604496 isoform X2 [Manihot esculenta]|uniref:Uncharacterized protein n=2 Tax=Manihot esculenta TaxID=3983 RepID=A0ACB7G1Z9_MANES|nr:uncharacterized protein LOC110604496 isoform X2 [Manihot esculenta]KAG8634210.1 hypothetical protein MANES_17G019300v8 [Manihot esculenta]KAG8634211.1 hypothetical protein MANES_17G019300v8 [Manihot esculenta]
MSSITKKRPKPASKSPKPEREPSLSSSSSHSPLMEPPHSLFPSKEELLRLIAVLAIASSVALTCNFIVSYINPTTKPFCDSNVDSSDPFSDFCEPCPKNGECSQGKLECARGFRKHRNICVEDGEINERAKKLSEWVENRLCEAYAQFLCHGMGKIWVQEDEIWNDLDGHQLMENLMPDSAINIFTKKKAMEMLGSLLEMRTNLYGSKELKCPDLVAEHYKPFICRLQQWIFKHAFVTSMLFVLVVASTLLLRKVQRRFYLSTRSEELYHQVCEILGENALMSKTSNVEPWLIASQLRDHLLLPKERKDTVLWKKVEKLVEEDSRVDRYPKLVKGESKVVWEWQVEGSWSSARMKKKVEARRLKSSEGIKPSSDQQIHALKSSKPLAE